MSLHNDDIASKMSLTKNGLKKPDFTIYIVLDNIDDNPRNKKGMPIIFTTILSFGLSYFHAIKARIGKRKIKGIIT